MSSRQMLPEFLSLVQVDGFEDVFINDIVHDKFFGMPLEPIIKAERRLRSPESSIAYFSMEYGLASSFYNHPNPTITTTRTRNMRYFRITGSPTIISL